ncbi:MAG: VIT1/CCC1 transporter family protein [Planctomycetes bacterium]|nr:VIT1/CCC1 transporter family protein [Planctomycetota bacterium]
MEALEGKKREIERKVRAREFVFGIQDGLISTVGLLTGVSVAVQNRWTVVMTGVVAAVTGGLSMATGSYLSAKTEKDLFEKEFLDQERLSREEPYLQQEALLDSLVKEGLERPAAYRVVQVMSSRQDLLLRTVQEKVLGLGTADISQPFRAGIVMFLSFILGAAVPLLPWLLSLGRLALPLSWAGSIAALLAVGVFKGVLTGKPVVRSGLEFAGVALGSAGAGWLVGKLFETLVGPMPGTV